jgi:hypothetical protein
MVVVPFVMVTMHSRTGLGLVCIAEETKKASRERKTRSFSCYQIKKNKIICILLGFDSMGLRFM